MSDPVSVVTDSPAATKAVAEAIGLAVDPVPRGGLVIVLLGDLGAGKTVFTAGLARGLGVPRETPVTSPTFTVAKAYRGRVPLHHVDAYMVRSLSELEAAGLEEMGGEGRVTCVEWGDRVPAAWPADRLEVTLTPLPVAVPASAGDFDFRQPPRRIDVRATGRQAQRVLDLAGAAIAALGLATP